MMSAVRFVAVLASNPRNAAGTYIAVPQKVARELGLRGMPKIKAVIGGHPYRGSLMPMGDGTFGLGVLKSIHDALGVGRGGRVTVELEVDAEPRRVEVPADLSAVLARDPAARARWTRLSYTAQKEMALSLTEAKRPETRGRRLAAAIASLRSG